MRPFNCHTVSQFTAFTAIITLWTVTFFYCTGCQCARRVHRESSLITASPSLQSQEGSLFSAPTPSGPVTSNSAPSGPVTTSGKEAQGVPSREPPEKIKKGVQTILAQALTSSDIPGIIIALDTPKWHWSTAAGHASLNPEIKARKEMKFRAASISKTFTAAAILKLSEEGRLKLDESPFRYLSGKFPASPALSRITIRMLLMHRSGLADFDAVTLMGKQRSHGDIPISAEESVDTVIGEGLLFSPGTSWAYSNAGYVLLSKVIDGTSSMNYEEYLHRRFIEPLSLSDTVTPTEPSAKEITGPHMRCIFRQKDGTWADATEMFFNWNRGGGDLITTAGDLNRFHRALRQGRSLRKETFQIMRRFSPTPLPVQALVAAGVESGYGCGYGLFRIRAEKMTLEGHVGGYSGAISSMIYWVEGDTYLSINSNGTYSPGYEIALIIPILNFLKNQAE